MDGHRWSCCRVGTKTCLRHRPAFIGREPCHHRAFYFQGKHCVIATSTPSLLIKMVIFYFWIRTTTAAVNTGWQRGKLQQELRIVWSCHWRWKALSGNWIAEGHLPSTSSCLPLAALLPCFAFLIIPPFLSMYRSVPFFSAALKIPPTCFLSARPSKA